MRAKIAKGVYWRTRLLPYQKVDENGVSRREAGELYLTNRRMVFLGSESRKSLSLGRMSDFIAFENGVLVFERSGRNAFVEFADNVDVFAMILGRTIMDVA